MAFRTNNPINVHNVVETAIENKIFMFATIMDDYVAVNKGMFLEQLDSMIRENCTFDNVLTLEWDEFGMLWINS